MTPAMLRARAPFLRGNLTGLALLMGIAGGVYVYTYKALLKDGDFEDVPVPDVSPEELRRLREEYGR